MARHLISTVRTLYSIMMRDLLNHQDTEETLKTKKSVNDENYVGVWVLRFAGTYFHKF